MSNILQRILELTENNERIKNTDAISRKKGEKLIKKT